MDEGLEHFFQKHPAMEKQTRQAAPPAATTWDKAEQNKGGSETGNIDDFLGGDMPSLFQFE